MLANFFSFQREWGESLGMFLLELKERKKNWNGDVCTYTASELQSNDSRGENIQTSKSSLFYRIS